MVIQFSDGLDILHPERREEMGEGAHDTVAGEEVPGLFDGFLTAILEISPFQSIDAPFFLIEILPVNPLEKQEKVHCLLLFPVLHVQPVPSPGT